MFKLFEDALKVWSERSSASLYGIFLFWLAMLNWKFIFNLFWEDSGKIVGSRADFAISEHFYITGDIVRDLLINLLVYFAPAVLITWMVIWYLPYLVKIAHTKSLSFQFERKKARLDYEVDYSQYKASKAVAKADAVVEQKQAEQRVESTLSDPQKWEIEAASLQDSPADLMALTVARDTIYRTSGRYTTEAPGSKGRPYISADTLSRIDTLGAADIDHQSLQMTPTPKGKFLFRYVEKNELIQARG